MSPVNCKSPLRHGPCGGVPEEWSLRLSPECNKSGTWQGPCLHSGAGGHGAGAFGATMARAKCPAHIAPNHALRRDTAGRRRALSAAKLQPPAGPAARSGFASEPVCLALFSLRMGVGGGAQSCACGGCRWVTHPHRSLLHQFWWGKAPLIGFVENDLPPVGREGMRLTASRAAPYPGGCLMRAKPAAAGCLPSPRSARPPGHRAALPAAARLRCFALESVAAAAPCWQRWASCAHSDQHRAAAFF